MSQAQLLRIRLKPGSTESVLRFLNSLEERSVEVTSAFAREGVISQSFFIERRDDAEWLYWYVNAKDLMRAAEINAHDNSLLANEARALGLEAFADIHAPEPISHLDISFASNHAPLEALAKAQARPVEPAAGPLRHRSQTLHS